MENMTKCFSLNYKHIVLDEIALDGLQGIGIESLWKRIGCSIGTPLTPKAQEKFWKFIIKTESISVYHVPEPPIVVDVIDRFTIIDQVTGYILDPPSHLDGPYEWCPIKDEYGSCSNYNERKLLPKNDLKSMTYAQIKSKYGDKIVMVASLEERWHALVPHLPIMYLNHLTTIHYGLLELIGRARENGQMSIGTTNLSKIIKEPKLLFYNRSVLHKLDMIEVYHTTQMTYGKAMKIILLRLKRFHQPTLGNFPKTGLINNIVNYLLKQPDHSEKNEVLIKNGIMTSKDTKRFQKTMSIFSFDEREVKMEKNTKSGKNFEILKKKFISLSPKSEESSSDEEREISPLQCQYKVGVGLLRQAYERILDAGLKGLTQTEIAQLLGVEFYTSRTICRIFKSKNLVREFLEDKGRQRTARYIAVAATKEIDKEYAKEKNLLLEHAKNAKETSEPMDNSDSESDIPIKKLKLEVDSKVCTKDKEENADKSITEVKILEGFENIKESLLNTKKNLTLRQLKYANGIIKVVKEQNYVIGFQTLGILVSKKINEPPMDTKGIKKFVHKLMSDGQLKVLKITNFNKFYYLICAPNVKQTDDVIKKIYIKLTKPKPNSNKNKILKKNVAFRPKWQLLSQRYIKIQKLHEFVTKFVYFNDKLETKFAPGFTSLVSIIPQMSVEFALSNTNNVNASHLPKANIEDYKELKIVDAPDKLKNFLLRSLSLQNSIKVNLKILAALGLIQLILQPSTSGRNAANILVFYVNRRAKILNTSGTWPRPIDECVVEKSFYFETFDDVEKYWLEVTDISSNTIIHVTKRESLKLVHPLRNETDVEMFDNGERFGDGLGPCGFDSSIFMDIPRLWRKFVSKNPILHQQTAPSKRKSKSIVKKKKLTKPKIVKMEALDATLLKRKKLADNPSVTWSEFEDKVLMLCCAAVTVLSPTSQSASLRIRNVVAKDLLTMIDPNKTAVYCHLRATIIASNSVLSYEKDCIVNEMRRCRHLVKKYEGLLKVLRNRHMASSAKFIQDAKLPLLELIWLASQIEKHKPYIQRTPCIALNIEDFNEKYTIARKTTNRPSNLYKTPTSEPEFTTLKEGILQTIMLSINNPVATEVSQKIYRIFEVYPETTLRKAVNQLRNSGALAAKEKCVNSFSQDVHFDGIVESSYKISAAYRRKFVSRFETELVVNVADIFSRDIPKQCLKGSAELNCFLCEMNTCGILEIKSDTIPMVTGSAGSLLQEEQMNVIDIETKYSLKSGTVGWNANCSLDNVLKIYEAIQFRSILDSISKKSSVAFSDSVVYDMEDPIIQYLENKGGKGSTFLELLEHLSMDRNTLCTRLEELDTKEIVKCVGYYENLLTLTKYILPTLFQVDQNIYILPSPWLTLEGQIQNEIFMKWTTVVINKVFESPGCSIEFLSNNFEYITTKSVQDICTFLHKCECVILRCIEKTAIDLFSEDDVMPELHKYNPYDAPDNILVFPVKNMVTKYAFLWKNIMHDVNKNI